METLATYFDLTFETRKIILSVIAEMFFATKHHQALYCLGKQKLVVKRNVSTPVLKRKNDPDSQSSTDFGVKKSPIPFKNKGTGGLKY